MRSKSRNILFVFWRCLVNNGHALVEVLTTPVIGKDAIKNVDLNVDNVSVKGLKTLNKLCRNLKKYLKC